MELLRDEDLTSVCGGDFGVQNGCIDELFNYVGSTVALVASVPTALSGVGVAAFGLAAALWGHSAYSLNVCDGGGSRTIIDEFGCHMLDN